MLTNRTTRRIEWGDCDPAGIVFNPQFFRFFDHATALLYEAAGWPRDRMVAAFGVSGAPLVATRAEFHAPVSYAQTVEIVSTVTRVGTKSFDVRHQLSRDGTPCCAGNETRCWTLNEDGRLTAVPIPAPLVAAFSA